MKRDPDDDQADDKNVQPKTKLNNHPHNLFQDLHKTHGLLLQEETIYAVRYEKTK